MTNVVDASNTNPSGELHLMYPSSHHVMRDDDIWHLEFTQQHLETISFLGMRVNSSAQTICYLVVLSVSPNKTGFLVLCFWFPAPVRCFVLSIFFFLVSLFLRLMHCLRIMLCRGINRVQDLCDRIRHVIYSVYAALAY